MRGRKGGSLNLIIVGCVLVITTIVGGVPMALALRHVPIRETPLMIMMFDIAIAAIFTLILSQTLASATMAFYERGDLDLLLSSPIPPRRVLTVRAVGIATMPFLWFAAILTIAVLPMAVLGQPRWLAGYPVIACVALLAAAAGVSLAMGLFKLIGARATRTVGQLMAAVIGASFFLISQSRNFLPDGGRRVFGGVMRWTQSGVFEPGSPLAWPARAVFGEPLPLLGFVALSVVIFAGVAAGLGRRFSADASVAAGVQSGAVRASDRAVSARSFGGGVFRHHAAQGAAAADSGPDAVVAGAASHALCRAADLCAGEECGATGKPSRLIDREHDQRGSHGVAGGGGDLHGGAGGR